MQENTEYKAKGHALATKAVNRALNHVDTAKAQVAKATSFARGVFDALREAAKQPK